MCCDAIQQESVTHVAPTVVVYQRRDNKMLIKGKRRDANAAACRLYPDRNAHFYTVLAEEVHRLLRPRDIGDHGYSCAMRRI